MMKMRFCPYCGAEMQEPDILFCTECGRKLPDYDGYYEDVLPIDEEREREGIDRELVKKLGCVVGALEVYREP